MTVADRIKQLRIELGLTQEDLAQRLGLEHKSSISKIEKAGDDITQKNIVKIANALHTTPEYLMGWEDKIKEEEHYYLDPEAREFAEFLFHNPEYKVLFSAARDVKKEDLAFVKDLLDRFGRKG